MFSDCEDMTLLSGQSARTPRVGGDASSSSKRVRTPSSHMPLCSGRLSTRKGELLTSTNCLVRTEDLGSESPTHAKRRGMKARSAELPEAGTLDDLLERAGISRWTTMILGLLLGWMSLGVLVFVVVERWHLVTALYVTMQIVTTVGYGDIVVNGEYTRLFMALYVLFGTVVVSAVISFLAEKFNGASSAVLKEQTMNMQKMRTGVQVRLDTTTSFGHYVHMAITFYENAPWKVIDLGFKFGLYIAAGTIFFATIESCTCENGNEGLLDGCIPDLCETTGGIQKTVLDCFYMSCVTLTTVGFGDVSPRSFWGQLFAIFWMIFGVMSAGNFISEFSSMLIEEKVKRKAYTQLDQELFDQIDLDGNGYLERYEFVTFVLEKYGLLTKEDLVEINHQFDQLDKTGDGKVTYEDILEAYSDGA